MAETAADFMPDPKEIAANTWLTDAELAVYAAEFSRTGLQGGLNWYRCRFEEELLDELRLFAGKTIDLPACFIAGSRDAVLRFVPGVDLVENMKRWIDDLRTCEIIDGAGHWIQQERAQEVNALLLGFLDTLDR